MITFSELYLLLNKHKKYILAILLVFILIGGGIYAHHRYVENIESAYQSGVKATDTKWQTKMDENKKKQDDFKSSQQAKVDILNSQIAGLRSQLEDKSKNGGEKLDTYSKSSQGQLHTLDDSSVEIYNDSLGIR